MVFDVSDILAVIHDIPDHSHYGTAKPKIKFTTEAQRTKRKPEEKGRGDIKLLSLCPLCDLCASAVKNLTVPI